MYLKRFLITVFILAFMLGNFSCKKDFSKISTSDWKPEIAAPFIHTTIVLNNLFADDSNLVTQADSTLIYFYHEDSVFKISADTLLEIEENIHQEQMFSLGELYMPSFGFDTDFTLNDILPYLDQEVQDTLIEYNGTENYFPPFSILEQITVDTEAIDDYVELTFSRGKLFVELSNGLPVALQNIDFNVVDVNNNFIIKNIFVTELLPDEQLLDSTDISGLTLGNKFAFEINSFENQGSFPDKVFIDLEEGLLFGLETRNLEVINGMAKITEQIMYSEISWIDIPVDDQQLFNILFSDGILTYNLHSDLNVGIMVNLSLPSSEINGNIPSQEFDLTAGGNVNEQWDISGMSTNLTTDPAQNFNRMPVQLEILILPTNYIVEFDSSDNVNGFLSMEELTIGYADGYLGQQIINISQDTLDFNFDFLKNLEGELILEEPSMTIDYTNSIGVPIRIKTELFGINTQTGVSQYLEYDSVDIVIPSEIGGEADGEILIDKYNSSIVDFMAFRPDRIIYYGGGITNPDGYSINFIDDNDKLIGNSELKIPLILRADHLSFSDTLAFSGSSDDIPLEEGLMQLNILNGFPFDLDMSLILSDSISGQTIDEIVFENIASAIVDDNGKVSEKILSEIIVEFDELFLENMKISNRILLEVETSTFENGSVPVVLYSNYEIKIAIGFLVKLSP